MRVLGLDPSMRNTGWALFEVEVDPIPAGGPDGAATFDRMTRLAGGTFKTLDTSVPQLQRFLQTTNYVHDLVAKHEPEVVVLEGALESGVDRNTAHRTLYSMIVAPWFPGSDALRYKAGGNGVAAPFDPTWVVTFRPERFADIVYENRHLRKGPDGRKVNKAKMNKERYLASFAGAVEHGRSVDEHQVDGAFLCHAGSRLVLSVLSGVWPPEVLTPRERKVFVSAVKMDHRRKKPWVDPKTGLGISTAMKDQEGVAWWCTLGS